MLRRLELQNLHSFILDECREREDECFQCAALSKPDVLVPKTEKE